MPTYEYACTKCGHQFEVMQSFSDAPLTKCGECSGKLRKVFSPPAIIFKGKGFYCTDNKRSSSMPSSPACANCPKDKGDSAPCQAGESAAS